MNIGARSDDDDNEHKLTATNEVPAFVQKALEKASVDSGIEISSDSGRTLNLKLLTFRVMETNQAMGASYEAVVHINATGQGDDSGWSSRGWGSVSRYGKKFSNENCNEVLSDALLEALAEIYQRYSSYLAETAASGVESDVE